MLSSATPICDDIFFDGRGPTAQLRSVEHRVTGQENHNQRQCMPLYISLSSLRREREGRERARAIETCWCLLKANIEMAN